MIKTRRDIEFQKSLAEQEAIEAREIAEEEEPMEQEEPSEEVSGGALRRLLTKGEMHMSRREFEEAANCFLAVIDSDESHLDALNHMGLLSLKIEDFPSAELYFSKLVNLKKDPVYFSNLGAALYSQSRLLEAAEAYENAIALDDRRANRLQSLAQVYHELGDGEKALKYFEAAAARKSKDNDLKIILAEYYRQMGRAEEALAALEKVLESDPYNDVVKKMVKEVKGGM
ncbi:tetratricopeptide repeat protein [Patescibacteria group bacterium]|nr:tetratricopeptide repeat protein [Patescibacteria group bacterium]